MHGNASIPIDMQAGLDDGPRSATHSHVQQFVSQVQIRPLLQLHQHKGRLIVYGMAEMIGAGSRVRSDSRNAHEPAAQGAQPWLKEALQSALERDPADALNDALVLAAILDTHLRVVFGLHDSD